MAKTTQILVNGMYAKNTWYMAWYYENNYNQRSSFDNILDVSPNLVSLRYLLISPILIIPPNLPIPPLLFLQIQLQKHQRSKLIII